MQIDGPARHTSQIVTADPNNANRDESQIEKQLLEDEDLEPDTTPMSNYLAESRSYRNSVAPDKAKAKTPLDKYLGGEMPIVHDLYPGMVYHNMEQEIIDAWDTYPTYKLIAIPFSLEVRQHLKHDKIQSCILAAVADITQSEEAGISAPAPFDTVITRRDDTPRSFLIHSLSKAHYQLLLRQRVWSSPDITFRIATPRPKCPDLFFTISEVSTLAPLAIQEMVKTIWNSPETRDKLEALVQEFLVANDLQPKPKLQAFIDSVHVVKINIQVTGGKQTPAYNVYASGCFIRIPKLWTDIRTYLSNLPYGVHKIGRGKAQIGQFDCKICHAADHPRGLCPFPNIQGWKGPTGVPEPTTDPNNLTRKQFHPYPRFRG